MLLLTATLFAALAIGFASGCSAGSRTVFVPESSPMRIGPNARFKVWIRTKGSDEWELSANNVEIPEGWWIVPPSFVKPE